MFLSFPSTLKLRVCMCRVLNNTQWKIYVLSALYVHCFTFSDTRDVSSSLQERSFVTKRSQADVFLSGLQWHHLSQWQGDSCHLHNKSVFSSLVTTCWAFAFSASSMPYLYQQPITLTKTNIADTSSPVGRRWSQSKHQGCEAVMNHKVAKDCCCAPPMNTIRFHRGEMLQDFIFHDGKS